MENNSSKYEGGQQKTGKAIYSFIDMVAGEAGEYAAEHTSPMSPFLEEIENYTLKKKRVPGCTPGRSTLTTYTIKSNAYSIESILYISNMVLGVLIKPQPNRKE